MDRISHDNPYVARFNSFFPVPRYLEMSSVGVDISDESIKYIELRNTSSGLRLGRFGSKSLDAGIVEQGEVRDVGKLTTALSALRERAHLQFVRASLPEQPAYFFQTKVDDDLGAGEIRHSLEFKLEEHVPVSAKEAVFDYDITEGHEKGKVSLGVNVYPRKALLPYLEGFEGSGLILRSFEVEAQAIARSVVPHGDQETRMIIDFGETRTGVSIVNHGMLAFTSTLEVCGADATNVIRSHNISHSDIANFKNTHGILKREGDKEGLHEGLMETVRKLKEETERHYQYWNSRHGEGEHPHAIDSILLCGGNANLAGLPEYLASALNVPVTRADVWQNAFSFDDSVPPITRPQSFAYATAIGLALREED